VTGVSSTHHVLGVELLLGELGDGKGTVLLGATGSKGSKANHEEVEARERDQIHGELAKIGVELARESNAGGNTGHGSRDEVVEVTIGRSGELEGPEADIVEGFIVKAHALISVLDELVDGEGSVVWLDDGVGDLGGGADGVGAHDAVRVLFTNLGDEEGAHACASAAAEGMRDLEALKAIARFGFLADNVKYRVDELSAFSVVTLGPVVTRTSLAEYEVVRAEELTEGASANGVHGAGLQVHEDSARDVTTTSGLVEVDIDALELEVRVAMVGTGGVNAVFVRDDFPELGADLVAALAALDVYEFSHGVNEVAVG